MRTSPFTSTQFQNSIHWVRQPIRQATPVKRHDQAVFSGNTEQPDAASGWWQYFSHILSNLMSAAPAKKSPFKIRANDPLPDGTLIASGAECIREEDQSQPARVILLSPSTMTAMEINRRQDRTLKDYLNSVTFRELKQQVPSASASEREEIAFLHELNKCTNYQFDKVGIPHHVQIANSDEKDYYSHYLNKMDAYITQGRRGKKPEYHASRLVGHSMRKGVGACRHRALLNLLSIREMQSPGLTATYTMGLLQDILEQNSDFSFNVVHVYNVVTMPSGRKYVVDPFNDPLNDSSGTVLPKKKIGSHKYPPNYVSFDHILKQANQNRTAEQDETGQQTSWLIRPSLTHKESYHTI